ncbi:MAG: hypothetical protein RLZZ306_1914 [Bacteroidota bacterium]|jgi:hypothetical protein
MKTKFKFPKLSILFIATILMLSYGCKKDEPVVTVDSCLANADLASKAGTTYGNNPTKANCEAFLASLNKYYDSCPGLTTTQRAELKADIAATQCQ